MLSVSLNKTFPSFLLSLYFIFQLLHSAVDSVEKKLHGAGGTLTLKCKDFIFIQLEMPNAEDCISVANSIEQLSNIGKHR